MKNPIFKKTLIFSLFGHIALFSIFSLSFGSRIPHADYAPVNFWGQMGKIELSNPSDTVIRGIKELFIKIPDTPKLNMPTGNPVLSGNYYLKPAALLSFNIEKEPFTKKASALTYPARRKEPVIIFHPLLPYDFTLYFKDRQLAHVELAFNIISNGKQTSPVIKRKISSGNLEVDLLSMRYISRYLFMQQASFTPNSWRTVKIDLSAQHD
jgi:hypothetical protein